MQAVTKIVFCVACADFVAPYSVVGIDPNHVGPGQPDYRRNRRVVERRWRWCQCERVGTRWRDAEAGQLEVSALDGPSGLRIIGLNNVFLQMAVEQPPAGHRQWRGLHELAAGSVGPQYLFHQERRACWAVVIAAGETGDVHFVPYAEASRPATVGG